ncbi:NepR family anti-sigma factor [uncultured Sulfitobacter sp.]|uniref:NepR family anti-sigma factor n=1 Tax=uncultured Sulfitobacter sp. TaxID=191468 RepID=UPI002615E394|nr:NepR family anti-sigma factor [uncultured Sulfitobacter sp.]
MTGRSQKKSHEGVIDENLRRVYEEAIEEGVPDRFKSLLEQLKQQDSEKDSSR